MELARGVTGDAGKVKLWIVFVRARVRACAGLCVKKQWCNSEICLERLQSSTVLTHSRVTYSFGPAIFILTTCL